MQELITLLAEFLESMPEDEFKQKLSSNFFKEIEAFLPLLSQEQVKEIKKLEFSKIKNGIKENAPQKFKLVSKLEKWFFLEKEFEKFKKKL